MKKRPLLSFGLLLFVSILLMQACVKDEDDEQDRDAKADEALNSISKIGEALAFSPQTEYDELVAGDVIGVSSGNTNYFIGYQQISPTNQDPILAKYVDGQQQWVRTDYETTADDNRGYGIIWDGADNLYAAFTCTGTQGDDNEDFRRFAANGWLSSYGEGGGAKVTILAKIDPATGNPITATYLKAKNSNDQANTLLVRELDFLNSGNVRLKADAWFSPLKPNKQPFTCMGDSPFDYTLELSSDLSLAYSASALGCDQ